MDFQWPSIIAVYVNFLMMKGMQFLFGIIFLILLLISKELTGIPKISEHSLEEFITSLKFVCDCFFLTSFLFTVSLLVSRFEFYEFCTLH